MDYFRVNSSAALYLPLFTVLDIQRETEFFVDFGKISCYAQTVSNKLITIIFNDYCASMPEQQLQTGSEIGKLRRTFIS